MQISMLAASLIYIKSSRTAVSAPNSVDRSQAVTLFGPLFPIQQRYNSCLSEPRGSITSQGRVLTMPLVPIGEESTPGGAGLQGAGAHQYLSAA